jgi:hypothetical protein
LGIYTNALIFNNGTIIPSDIMKSILKTLLFSAPVFLFISCGIINSDNDQDYEWFGEWKRTDASSGNYMVLTADSMFVFTNPTISEEWINCDENKEAYPMINKTEASFTVSYNRDPLFVGIESFPPDLNSLVLRFEGESDTESYERSNLPDNCSYDRIQDEN